MSLQEFINKNTPSVLQSLFRREIGLVGICGQYGKETNNTIDVIIHRQLIQRRAPRSGNRSSGSDSESESESDSDSDYDSDRESVNPHDITISLRNTLLSENWSSPENSDVVNFDGIFFIRMGNCIPYIVHEIDLGLRQNPVIRSIYRSPSVNIWSKSQVFWPSLSSQAQMTRKQHGILFIIDYPGHVLQSFHFDSGKRYRMIHLDPEVRFKSLELSTEVLILDSQKSSIGAGFDHAVADFIIFQCPDLQLVTRCRITKAAVGNSIVEIEGDFIFLINAHRIELYDLKETIKSSYQLEPTGYVPAEGLKEGIPYTHLVQEKPVCLYVVQNTGYSYLEFGHALWPPYYVKRDQFGKFWVLPMSDSGESGRKMVGVDFLNLVDNNVPHEEDNLWFHPDQSGRLVLTGYTGIRVILINKFQDEFGIGTTHFTVQFSKTLGKSTPKVPETSRRPGLRAIRCRNYVDDIISDEDRGIIRWEYSSKLDLFVILELSSTIFQITMFENQSWEPIALINLSDLLAQPKDYTNYDYDYISYFYSIDVLDGYIAISKYRRNETYVNKLLLVNLLSDDN